MISVDTLRADRLGAYGHPTVQTPALDAFAAQSVLFENHTSTAPTTLNAHSSMMTGRYPRQQSTGARNGDTRLEGQTTLAERFAEAGWTTGAFVSNVVLQRRSGLDRGFDHYDARLPAREVGRTSFERSADETVDAALAWLDQQDRVYTLPRKTRGSHSVSEVAGCGQEHGGVRVPVGAKVLHGADLRGHSVGGGDTIGTRHAGHGVSQVGERRGDASADGGGATDDVHGVPGSCGRVDLTNGQRRRALQRVRVGEDHRTGHSTGEGSSRQGVGVALTADQHGRGGVVVVRRDRGRGRGRVLVDAGNPGRLGHGLQTRGRARRKCEARTSHEDG